MSLQRVITFAEPTSDPHNYFCIAGHAKPATVPFSIFSPNKLVWCASCRKGFVGVNWTCQCNKVWFNCPIHQPILRGDHHTVRPVQPKAKPRARSAAASARSLVQIEPSVASRPCIGPTLQRRFPHLRQLVSPALQTVQPEHEECCNRSSSQPPPPRPPTRLMVLNTPSTLRLRRLIKMRQAGM